MPKPEEFAINTGKKLIIKKNNRLFETVYVVSHSRGEEVNLFVSANTSNALDGELLTLTLADSEAMITVGDEQVFIYLLGWGTKGPQLGFMNPSKRVNIDPYTNS